MQAELNIDWTRVLHTRENNADSERHLHENTYKFIGQAAVIKSLLEKGEVLTVAGAFAMKPRITSLPRRILDLKQRGKMPIETRWVLDEKGKRSHVEYFLTKK